MFCFAVDQRALDDAFIQGVAAQLAAIRDGQQPDPTGGRVSAKLQNEDSSFYEALPPEFTQGAAVFWQPPQCGGSVRARVSLL